MELVPDVGLSEDPRVIGRRRVEGVVTSGEHLRSMEVSVSMAACALARLFRRSILICACMSLSLWSVVHSPLVSVMLV